MPVAPRPNVYSSRCASRRTLDLIASTWTVLVVRALQDGPERYSALLRRVDGISRPVLTRTLRRLVEDGLVERTVRGVRPPLEVTYSLTALGASLGGPLSALADWAMDHLPEVEAARTRRAPVHGVEPGA